MAKHRTLHGIATDVGVLTYHIMYYIVHSKLHAMTTKNNHLFEDGESVFYHDNGFKVEGVRDLFRQMTKAEFASLKEGDRIWLDRDHSANGKVDGFTLCVIQSVTTSKGKTVAIRYQGGMRTAEGYYAIFVVSDEKTLHELVTTDPVHQKILERRKILL